MRRTRPHSWRCARRSSAEHARPVRIACVWVSYEQISPQPRARHDRGEDAKFVEHEGFDWDGIQQALDRNYRKGRVVAGGSTITQQLAKNLLPVVAAELLAQGEEAAITVMLEALLDKRRIFELYLNVIEWGDGIFGCEAASRRYFGMSARDLSAEQAARLCRDGPQPEVLRTTPGSPRSRPQDPDRPRADAFGRVAVVAIVGHDWRCPALGARLDAVERRISRWLIAHRQCCCASARRSTACSSSRSGRSAQSVPNKRGSCGLRPASRTGLRTWSSTSGCSRSIISDGERREEFIEEAKGCIRL